MLAVVIAVGAPRGGRVSNGEEDGKDGEPIVFELLAADEAYFLEHFVRWENGRET